MQAAKQPLRAVSGVLLLHKPFGLSSNAVVQRAKRCLRAAKVGHTGTLDPMASGLLPLLFGEATKFANRLLNANKGYRATVALGYASTTGDVEGNITPHSGGAFSGLLANPLTDAIHTEHIQQVLQGFLGEQTQVPPMHSALKKNGVKLCDLARKGIEIEREARTITVHQINLLGIEHGFFEHKPQPSQVGSHANAGLCTTYPAWLMHIDVLVSKGTYIRTLAEDIAKAFGTNGFLTRLVRTQVGPFALNDAVYLDELETLSTQIDTKLNDFEATGHAEGHQHRAWLPVDALVNHMPMVYLPSAEAQRFSFGQRLNWSKVNHNEQTFFRVYGPSGFLGTAMQSGNTLQPFRLLQVNHDSRTS